MANKWGKIKANRRGAGTPSTALTTVPRVSRKAAGMSIVPSPVARNHNPVNVSHAALSQRPAILAYPLSVEGAAA